MEASDRLLNSRARAERRASTTLAARERLLRRDVEPLRTDTGVKAAGLVALRILPVPSWHTPSERKIKTPITHSLPPFHLRSPLLSLHLALSSLLPVNCDRTPEPRSSDRLNLSFGSSNSRCTPPIVYSIPARAPRGARALLV